jgi:hypothetical protein
MHLSSAKITLPSKLCFILIISVLLGICYSLTLPEDELSNSNSRTRQLFFLILGYDRFLNGRVWNLFFKDVESEKYRVLMHVKNLRKYHPNSFEQKITLVDQKWTEYCKITNASNELVDAALSMSNSDDDVFFLISADTIPVKSFNELFQIFSNPGFKSRLCYSPTDQWKMIKENIYLPKVHSWFVFNKEVGKTSFHSSIMIIIIIIHLLLFIYYFYLLLLLSLFLVSNITYHQNTLIISLLGRSQNKRRG